MRIGDNVTLANGDPAVIVDTFINDDGETIMEVENQRTGATTDTYPFLLKARNE